jgi:hypothetical protein
MSSKDDAIKLRKAGYSYTEISKKTGLAKSTLSYHLSNIKYTPNRETEKNIGLARTKAAITKSKQKQKTLNDAKRIARKDIGILTDRDIFMLGLGLYIGEGSKTHDIVRLVNSDPLVLKCFIKWIKQIGLKSDNLMLRVHLYPESNIKESENFWLKELGLPKTSIQKTYIDTRLRKYGTAHVTVKSNGNKAFGVILSRKIGAYMEEVLE